MPQAMTNIAQAAWISGIFFNTILSLSSMDLAINNVTNLGNFVGKMVCVCVCVWVYLDLLSHFLLFKIHVTNISPILIKMVDFKNLAWATSFATRASRKFIYLPYRASGKKVIVIPWTSTAVCSMWKTAPFLLFFPCKRFPVLTMIVMFLWGIKIQELTS